MFNSALLSKTLMNTPNMHFPVCLVTRQDRVSAAEPGQGPFLELYWKQLKATQSIAFFPVGGKREQKNKKAHALRLLPFSAKYRHLWQLQWWYPYASWQIVTSVVKMTR